MGETMYNLKKIICGKRLEIYKINNYVINTKGEEITGEIFKDNNGRVGDESLDEEIKENNSIRSRETTLNNARNNIIRLIKCNEDMRAFITLTFKFESNYKDSKKLLNNLFNKLRKTYTDLKYLWVLEYGDLHNRLHYHVLTNIPIEIKLSSSKEKKSKEHKQLENSFRIKYWKHGWVDIRELDQEGNTNIALYVAAYITKDLINKQFEGYRIYGYSIKTLDKPIEEKIYTLEDTESLIVRHSKDYEIKYSNSYGIGYTDHKGEHTGQVNYFDLIKKED